jgi:hypothetical protein
MGCNYYFKFESGSISKDEFNEHIRDCEICRTKQEQDEKLLSLAGSLRQPVVDSGLWTKIEEGVVIEARQSTKRKIWSLNYKNVLLRVAAVLILAASALLFYLHKSDAPDKGILEARALQSVNKTEQEYEKAINKLEQMASAELSKFDLNLQLLYRDKLETIDSQIMACREALESNPANAHIRRYLFMALQDKKDTLKEIISIPADMDKKDS